MLGAIRPLVLQGAAGSLQILIAEERRRKDEIPKTRDVPEFGKSLIYRHEWVEICSRRSIGAGVNFMENHCGNDGHSDDSLIGGSGAS